MILMCFGCRGDSAAFFFTGEAEFEHRSRGTSAALEGGHVWLQDCTASWSSLKYFILAYRMVAYVPYLYYRSEYFQLQYYN
jgi:hypothetical protein